MQRLILVLLLFSLPLKAFCQKEESQDFKVPRTLIKLAPLYFFTSTLEMGIEGFNAPRNKSFNLDLGFRSGSSDYRSGRGVNVELAYRKYVSGMKLHTRKDRQFYQGIYYSVFARGSYFKGDEPYYYIGSPDPVVSKETIWSVGPGFTLGLQKTLWQILYLDIFVGGGIKFSTTDKGDPYFENTVTDPGYDGIYPKIGAKIGISL